MPTVLHLFQSTSLLNFLLWQTTRCHLLGQLAHGNPMLYPFQSSCLLAKLLMVVSLVNLHSLCCMLNIFQSGRLFDCLVDPSSPGQTTHNVTMQR